MAAPHNKGKGHGIKWVRDHISYTGDDCLIWPWSKRRGYAVVCMDGKQPFVSRLMCEIIYGPPPTPKHEAAHSCGHGHLGCANPKHVSWKTRTDNQRDRRAHGTAGKAGSSHLRFKLTLEQVAEIRALEGTASMEALGARFGVTPANIAKILKRKTWRTGEYNYGGFAVVPYQRGVHSR